MSLTDFLTELRLQLIYGKEKYVYEEPTETIETTSAIYRPITFNDYIGQEKAKNILKSFIKGTNKFETVFPHTIIHGNAGCGKTTLARIIANEVDVTLTELLAKDIEIDEFLRTLDTIEGGIIFLDEVHRMNRDTVEKLYSIMEDFTWNGVAVPQFTLIGATTEIGEIIKTRRPFYDRFKIIIELEDYTNDDMYKLLSKYVDKTFSEETKKITAMKIISKNSRLTPRKAIRLTDYLYYSGKAVTKVLIDNGIIDKGFTDKDLKVLAYLNEINKPIGIDSLSLYLDVPAVTYNYEIEPYLVKTGCIVRTSKGRTITKQGIEELKNLQNKIKTRK